MKDYDELLNEEIKHAHHAMIESDLMINHGITSFLDSDPLNENPFEALKGMAAGFGNSLKAMGQHMGNAVKIIFKALVVDFYNAAFLAMLQAGLKESDIQDDALEHAKTLKLAEAAIAVPCMWWVWTNSKGTLNKAQEIALRYGESAEDKDVLALIDAIKGQKESIDRQALDRLFDSWTMSGDVLLEGQNDYLDKALDTDFKALLNSAQNEVASNIDGEELAQEIKKWLQNIQLKELAVLVLSSWISDDNNVAPLKAAYEHDGELEDEPAAWMKKFESSMTGRVKRLAVMAVFWKVVKKKNLDDQFGTRAFSLSLNAAFQDFEPKYYNKWEDHAESKGKQVTDLDLAAEFFEKESGTEGTSKGLSSARPREMISAILGHKGFYEATWKNIGKRNLDKSRQILTDNWKETQKKATSIVTVATLADFNGLPGELKNEIDKAINSDDKIKTAWGAAKEENDEEVASRVLAIVRTSFAESAVELLKTIVEERAGNVEKLKAEAEAVDGTLEVADGNTLTFKYKSDDDPAWKAYEAMRAEVDDGVVSTFEQGTSQLKTQAEKAQKELEEILAARTGEAPEEGEEMSGPDAGPAET